MTLILILLAIVATAELSLWLPALWPMRALVARGLLVSNALLLLILLAIHPAIWTLGVVFLGIYRVINMMRIIGGRIHSDYLYHGTRRTSVVLIIAQVIVALSALLITANDIDSRLVQYVFAVMQLVAALAILVNFQRQLRTTLPPEPDGTVSTQDLPSVTVCVPARNETDELEQCLRSLVASNYRKLEILVLDDCSQNKRTPEIIREFAHDGVRFIAGTPPPDHWLAKNFTYERLAHEANSDLLLFCGVDVRFTPDSLTLLVTVMLQKHKSMLSIVPRNALPIKHTVLSTLVQPGRYAWEFLLPRRWLGRPAALSTCWLITRQMLESAGGFAAFKQSVIPERHIARRAAQQGDSYGFLRASSGMCITSVKNYSEQLATGIRTRYPQLHRRPESVALYGLLASSMLIWPFKLCLLAVFAGSWPLAVLTALTCVALLFIGFNLVTLTYHKQLWLGTIVWPFIVIYDIALLNYSMWQYEFHEVLWKGRNVCVPVMRIIPRLPDLD